MIRVSVYTVAILALAGDAHAQTAISPSVVSAGAFTGSVGSITLSTTVGQPVVGTAVASSIALHSGYWFQVANCPADFNGNGSLSVQDIFDYLSAWFAGNPNADFNGNGSLSVQDIFDFLVAWFGGC